MRPATSLSNSLELAHVPPTARRLEDNHAIYRCQRLTPLELMVSAARARSTRKVCPPLGRELATQVKERDRARRGIAAYRIADHPCRMHQRQPGCGTKPSKSAPDPDAETSTGLAR